VIESRAPHTLLALAEAGHGVAIIPSILATDRYYLRIFRVAHRHMDGQKRTLSATEPNGIGLVCRRSCPLSH
jgi:DNA-binding transcriptional LysR family regulator